MAMFKIFRLQAFCTNLLFISSTLLITPSAIAGNTYVECLKDLGRNDSPIDKNMWDRSLAVIQAFKSGEIVEVAKLARWPLVRGPLKSDFLSRPLDFWFEKDVIDLIATSKPACAPFNYRGFMFGNGVLWLNYDGEISSMNAAKELPFEPYLDVKNLGWNANDLISPECIQYEWASSDNVEEWASYSNVDQSEISLSPGLFVTEKNTRPFCASWGSNKEGKCLEKDKLSLAWPKEKCTLKVTDANVESLQMKIIEPLQHSEESYSSESYKILGDLPLEICTKNSSGYLTVIRCFAAENYEYRSSSYGVHAIYSGGLVGPIKMFTIENDLKNFLKSN